MRRGELSPTAAAGRGLLRSDLGLPPHDMKASASLPALIPNGVHKNATIGTIAVPKNSLKFKIPGEGGMRFTTHRKNMHNTTTYIALLKTAPPY